MLIFNSYFDITRGYWKHHGDQDLDGQLIQTSKMCIPLRKWVRKCDGSSISNCCSYVETVYAHIMMYAIIHTHISYIIPISYIHISYIPISYIHISCVCIFIYVYKGMIFNYRYHRDDRLDITDGIHPNHMASSTTNWLHPCPAGSLRRDNSADFDEFLHGVSLACGFRRRCRGHWPVERRGSYVRKFPDPIIPSFLFVGTLPEDERRSKMPTI